MNKFSQEEHLVKLTNTKEIVGFRNRLIHSYDNLDDAIVWVILKKYLPTLYKEVQSISNED